MIFVPLPRLVLPTFGSLSSWSKATVDEGFANIQPTSNLQVFC
jgi:hypothetical protein